MISKEKLEELRQRMIHHEVENDVAVVKLTAKELSDLLEVADGWQRISDIMTRIFVGETNEPHF